MLTYQKNTLLALLANFKARLYSYQCDCNKNYGNKDLAGSHDIDCQARLTIDRNITSIEKQIKRL